MPAVLIKCLALFFLFWTMPFDSEEIDHKFYVSTTTIEYNLTTQSLQISAQVFTEDLETALREKNQELRLDPDSNQDLIDQNISIYLKEKLQFFIGESQLDYNFLGKEYVNDITKCYLELTFETPPAQIKLFNRLFFNLFIDQQNIVHFKNLTERKSYLLHKKEPAVILSFAL